MAVSWIERSSDDELADYLPQLVQVQLKIPAVLHIDLKPSAVRPQFPTVPRRLPPPTLRFFLCFQAVKFECHLKNSLVMFLLSRAQGNINIAHYLYW